MTHRLFKAAAAIALALPLLFAISCKKSSNNSNNNNVSNATKIIGTWTKIFDARDNNGNTTIESSEKTPLAAGDYDYNIYNSNGTAVDSSRYGGNKFKVTFPYTVSGGYLTISALGTTFTTRFTQLDDHNLILQDTSHHPTTWTGYTR